jgi:hypothetical protein
MVRARFRSITAIGVFATLAMLIAPLAADRAVIAQADAHLLVYHQITEMPSVTGSVGFPVLSADGTVAVFTDAPGSGDPEVPNRIFTIADDGSQMTEVDAYQSHCFCTSEVAISADGSTILSTESMQLRMVQDGGEARTIAEFTSNEMSSIRLTDDGSRAFFILGRDTVLVGATEPLQRGVYAVNADGSDLQQIVGPDQIGKLLGLTPDAIGMLRTYIQALDVSSDGTQLVFGVTTPTGAAVLSVASDGSNLALHRDGLEFVMRVAMSGDGATIAYDVRPTDTASDVNEIIMASTQGGEPRTLLEGIDGGFSEPIRLNPDGSTLLISPNGLLVDTVSGEAQLLAAPIANAGGNHEAVITEGLPRATMDDTARRFLYVMRTTRCADCANQSEQLAVLAIDPVDLGEAPVIANTSLEPGAIELEYASAATVQATVDTSGSVIGVGFAALLGSLIDVNVSHGLLLHDDGQSGDAIAGDGIYTAAGIVHGPVVLRENDAGPRTIRLAAEIEGANGLRHATATDIGTLVVGEEPSVQEATPNAAD